MHFFVAAIIYLALGHNFIQAGNMVSKSLPDTDKYRALSLYYESSGGEKALTTYEYDQSGFLRIAVWEQFDKFRNSLNFYTHDENGRLLRKYREFSDRITSEQLYTYDNKGRLIRETFERSDGIKGTAEYEYDKNGNLLKTICDRDKGWFTGILMSRYDNFGRRIAADIIQNGNKVGTIEYTYDSDGNLTKEYWNFSGRWSQTFIYEYGIFNSNAPVHYTSSNVFINEKNPYRMSGEHYEYSDGSGGPSYFKYDEAGKLVHKRYEHSNGLYTNTSFLYDMYGLLTKSYRAYSSGLSAVFSYEFDDAGKLIKRTYNRSDIRDGEEVYEYDSAGRLVGGKIINFDNWLSGTLSFNYNDDGRMATGFFKGDNKFDADLTFEYDANGNLVEIKWIFTFGDTQTYRFNYEETGTNDKE